MISGTTMYLIASAVFGAIAQLFQEVIIMIIGTVVLFVSTVSFVLIPVTTPFVAAIGLV